MNVRELLNRLKWDPALSLSECVVVITHRGGIGGVKSIPGSAIKELGKYFFTYDENGRSLTIPYHRVREVKNLRSGATLFKRG